jgi:hypothetical protein
VEGEEAERSATFAISSEQGRPAQFDWLPWLGVTGSSRVRDGPGVDKERGHFPNIVLAMSLGGPFIGAMENATF